MQHPAAAVLLAASAGAMTADPATGQVQYNAVALSGATGTSRGLGPNLGPGVHFWSLGFPSINNAGEIAFEATDTLTLASTIYSNPGGAMTVVAKEGAAGPGPNLGPGVEFIDLTRGRLNDAGAVSFLATLTDSGGIGVANVGAFHNASGAVTAVARDSASGPGPNLGAGVQFGGLGMPLLNEAGRTAFRAKVSGTGVVADVNDVGIFTDATGLMAAVARTGAAGPGPNLGADVTFATLETPVFNDVGTVAFRGGLLGPSLFPGYDAGIFAATAGGTVTTLAWTRAEGPGRGPNLGAGVRFAGLYGPSINAAGTVAFYAGLTGTGISSANNAGIFTHEGGMNTLVAREGAAGPGPANLGAGVSFTELREPLVNAAGDVAFLASIGGTGVTFANDRVLVNGAGGTLNVVAREGANGPGLPANVLFSDFRSLFFNAAGGLAFEAQLGGAVDMDSDVALYVAAGDVLHLIAREGDTFDVDTGPDVDLRRIVSLNFAGNAGSGGEDGHASPFNDSSVVAFQLYFADGSRGIFTAAVPEPAAFALALPALAAAAGTRRRRRQRA